MMPATLTPVNPNYIAPLKPEDIVRFAPQVTFHPNERSFPCSIQHLLTGATLKSHSDAHLSVPLQGDPSRLAPYDTTDGAYVDVNPSQYPGSVPVNGRVGAPVYVSVQFNDPYIDINYFFLYAYQGGQTVNALRAGSHFRCILNDYGRHQGDIESIAVRVLASKPDNILAVGYEQHGSKTWFKPGQYEADGDHPIVRAALNGHASYNAITMNEEDWIVTGGQSGIVDVVDVIHRKPSAVWKPYDGGELVLIGRGDDGAPLTDQRWVTFCGRFGTQWTNHLTGATYLDGSNLNMWDWDYVKILDWMANNPKLAVGLIGGLLSAATLGTFAVIGAGAAIATGVVASKLPSNLVASGGDDSPTNGIGPGAFGGRSNVWLHQSPVYNRIKSMADARMVLTFKAAGAQRTLIVNQQSVGNDAELWRIDDWGDNGFAIINKEARLVLQAGGNADPILLVPWVPGLLGDHCRWDLGGDEGLDYHALRPKWDTGQNADVWGGGAAAGQEVHTGGWNGGPNQKWRFVPDGDFLFEIRPRANTDFAVAVASNGRLVMKRCTPEQAKSDAHVQWSLIARGGLSFALINKATGLVARAGGNRDPVVLVDRARIDNHAEWNFGGQEGGSGYFYAVRPNWDTGQNWDGWGGTIAEGTEVHTGGWNGGDNQKWGFFANGSADSMEPVF